MTDEDNWWREAVVYQVYVPSFADANGDGIGDIRGVQSKLDYLAALGVDAIWLTPFYPSPWADAGYDVSDYRDVDPRHGTLDDVRALLAQAHGHGIRVIVDIVPNHCSDQHPWFQEALAAAPGSPARNRFIFRDGQGPDGSLPPADWQSKFGGGAWTRVPDGQWYMHIFAAEQPDLNWENPEVRADFDDTLRFWLDLGVDGFRIDVAHGLRKDLVQPLRNTHGMDTAPLNAPPEGNDHPFWDRDEVHEIYRAWRKIIDEYQPPRATVAEAGVSLSRLPLYTRPDELHQAFNFFYLRSTWDADSFRTVIDASLAGATSVGATTTWVLSNHDVVRHRSRYGLPADTDTVAWLLSGGTSPQVDEPAARRRARAAALLTLALPGSAYVYQGEELGLPEVADLPLDSLRDPMWERTGHARKGRDGCRVPLPWTSSGPSFGFGSAGSWLPQPEDWGRYSAEAQQGVPDSFLELYRTAIHLRRRFRGDEHFAWLPVADEHQVLAFRKGAGLVCVVNFGSDPIPLPSGELLLTSDPLVDGQLPGDTGAWLRA